MDNLTEETTGEQPPVPEGGKKKRKIVVYGAIGVGVVIGALLFYFFYLQHPSRQALAQINGEKITVENLNGELAKVQSPVQDMYREEPDKFLELLILRILLLQEAKKQGITVPAKTYKDATKDAKPEEEVVIEELFKKKFSTPPAVEKEEIEAFYSMFKDRMGGKSLKEVSPFIEQMIREAKQQEQMTRFVEELRNGAKVEIDKERLKKIAAKPPDSNTDKELEGALKSGKPLLVDFGANNCLPCRQMRPVLKELSTEYSEKAKILVIDVNKYQDLARQYKIQVVPTLVFFDGKGAEVFRYVGALNKDQILAKLKEIGMAT